MTLSQIFILLICAGMGFGVVFNVMSSAKPGTESGDREAETPPGDEAQSNGDRQDADSADWRKSTPDSWYGILGLPPTASYADAKDAYRNLIQQYHPDRFTSAAPEIQHYAAERAKAINAAFKTAEGRARR